MKVAITTSSFAEFSQEPLTIFKENEVIYKLNPYKRTLSEDETIGFLEGCIGVLAGTESYTAKVLEALPELKYISRCGAGLDSIDLEKAKSLDIEIFNTPDAPTKAVAELTLALAFNLMRFVTVQDRAIRLGQWQKKMGFLLTEKRIGIVGMGRIGKEVALLLMNLGVKDIAYADPYVDLFEYPKKELDELLAWADIITLHLPKASEKALLSDREFELMPQGSFLINCARGGLVDEFALEKALKSGKLLGAALDVYAKEPYSGPLLKLDNIILTPHIGSYARESRVQMELMAVKNLVQAMSF